MAVTAEMAEEDSKRFEEFRRRVGNGLVVTDIDQLHMDITEGIAEDIGMGEAYRAFVKNISYERIRKQMELLRGYSVERGATKIGEPYSGSKELIETFRKHGLEVFGLTDNPLATVPENQKVIQEKLGIQHIYSTSTAEVREGIYTGELSRYHPKEELIEHLVSVFHPKKIIGIFQGENDHGAAEKVKEKGGKVFIVNSNSQILNKLADFHSENTEKAAEIAEKEILQSLNG